ncbi:hypothetical protein VTK56DRAFT_474 [Thermocarpiscus australiensis]
MKFTPACSFFLRQTPREQVDRRSRVRSRLSLPRPSRRLTAQDDSNSPKLRLVPHGSRRWLPRWKTAYSRYGIKGVSTVPLCSMGRNSRPLNKGGRSFRGTCVVHAHHVIHYIEGKQTVMNPTHPKSTSHYHGGIEEAETREAGITECFCPNALAVSPLHHPSVLRAPSLRPTMLPTQP